MSEIRKNYLLLRWMNNEASGTRDDGGRKDLARNKGMDWRGLSMGKFGGWKRQTTFEQRLKWVRRNERRKISTVSFLYRVSIIEVNSIDHLKEDGGRWKSGLPDEKLLVFSKKLGFSQFYGLNLFDCLMGLGEQDMWQSCRVSI